jgi:hypothetical protein
METTMLNRPRLRTCIVALIAALWVAPSWAQGGMGPGPGTVHSTGGPAWATLVNPTLSGSEAGFNNNTDRQTFAVATYSGGAPSTGTKIRVTFKAGSIGCMVAAAYVGHAAGLGDAYDFDGSQVQLLFSASAGFTAGNNATQLSDEINFSFNKTKALVVSFYINGGADSVAQATGQGANYTRNYKINDDASTTNTSGYATDSGFIDFVDLIEVFG